MRPEPFDPLLVQQYDEEEEEEEDFIAPTMGKLAV